MRVDTKRIDTAVESAHRHNCSTVNLALIAAVLCLKGAGCGYYCEAVQENKEYGYGGEGTTGVHQSAYAWQPYVE